MFEDVLAMSNFSLELKGCKIRSSTNWLLVGLAPLTMLPRDIVLSLTTVNSRLSSHFAYLLKKGGGDVDHVIYTQPFFCPPGGQLGKAHTRAGIPPRFLWSTKPPNKTYKPLFCSSFYEAWNNENFKFSNVNSKWIFKAHRSRSSRSDSRLTPED
jgi:hypothetical protein